ncbi:MAG: hypothetical protein K2H49_02630, partial [Muribaculaceae bacterium]|nr:hypothetical protein [Muribaculaceae bacterium]
YTREYVKCLEHCNNAFGGADVDPSSFMTTYFQNTSNFYSLADHGKFNQGTDKPHNFLLIPTYSIAVRHMAGNKRYGVIRDALNATLHSCSPAWKEGYQFYLTSGKGNEFYMHPCLMGSLFINGKSEYGLIYAGNISEHFEYTDKIAGIGYCHVTRSEFTAEEVILTRAEAKLFLGDIDGAVADLSIWEKSRRECMGTETYGDHFKDLTVKNIREFYVENDPGYGIAKTINIDMICPSKWTLGGDDETGVLQCIQHFRRIEMIHTGMRWFDIKRFGLEFDRKIGKDGSDHLGIFDERKAVQIPASIVAAGMQQNPRGEAPEAQSPSSYVLVSK